LDAGVVPDTLGADMHGHNTRALGPAATARTAPSATAGTAPSATAGTAPSTAAGTAPSANAGTAPNAAAPVAEEDEHLFAGKTPFSLVSAMTSMLALGLPLERVIPMVTSNAARMIGMEDTLGHLRVGGIADVSVLADDRGRWVLCDNEGTRVVAERRLQPLFCLRAGRRFDATAPILPTLAEQ
jgi:dihydroorotase